MDWSKITARRDEKHLCFKIGCVLHKRTDGMFDYSGSAPELLISQQPLIALNGKAKWKECINSHYVDSKFIKEMFHSMREPYQIEAFSALLAICAGIHRSLVNSPPKAQWRGALIFSLICAWMNGCVNNREAGDLRRYRPYYDVIVMESSMVFWCYFIILMNIYNIGTLLLATVLHKSYHSLSILRYAH